ncbi:MAG: amylosucrase [Planctomycetota bacterium]
MVESELSDDLAEVEYRSRLTLNRIAPRLDEFWKAQSDYPQRWQRRIEFFQRLDRYWLPLFERLESLYGHRGDFHYHVEQLLLSLASFQLMRNDDLCEVDRQREVEPNWFQSNRIVGGALYVDLFSENLPKLREHVGYFKSLGITYLHLMPLFAVRPGNSDGGYAISNYRSVDPRLGTIDDLRQLANDLHQEGILLVLDFVFNHTSDDHEWAIKAQSGNREYQDFYFLFPDRSQPDRYEQTLREIFPTVRRGNFSWHDGMKKWVWTTFNSFQWDLNYSNPSVFRSMMEEMLFISNLGVDVMRLDAVAFIWKQLGTSCENLPQAHTIIQAFNLGVRIASPGLIFKSEAIVHPDEVVKYISRGECQISYNPTLMALIWESLATRKTDLLRQTLSHRFRLPRATTWVNYLRCHDDIGWTFDDGDASAIGMNASDHRSFLNQFYTGQFPDSFARGIPFQHNLQTGDMRISGTLASLAGLEQALEANDDWKIELAARRIYLMQAISLSIGGIPLIYLGEEWGMLNDYDFISDPAKADDSRWVHRPKMNWAFVESIRNQSSENHASEVPNSAKNVHSEIYCKVKSLIELRKSTSALAGQEMDIFETGNPHLLGFVRRNEGDRLIVLANFSDSTQSIGSIFVRTVGFSRFFKDLIEDKEVNASDKIELSPYQFLWLERA